VLRSHYVVCNELLATIKEHHGWLKEQCSTHKLKMKLRTEGGPLGAIALVKLQVQVDETSKVEC